jgi:transforming growth factor-beta-induced protein
MKTTMRKFGLWALPALVLTLGACDDDDTTAPEPQTVVDVAISVNESTGEFSTLIAALVAADLVETLQGTGPFTVFAPTDAAFAELNLNASNIGSLPTGTLTDILLYHVTAGRRDAASVTGASSITMVGGGTTAITVNASGAFINDAQIVQTDVGADNGIIHVIDAVLMP